jgi:3-hexulose-6-phosphate synthase
LLKIFTGHCQASNLPLCRPNKAPCSPATVHGLLGTQGETISKSWLATEKFGSGLKSAAKVLKANKARMQSRDVINYRLPSYSFGLAAAMKATVQLSLDLIDLDEAIRTADMAIRAGVDWLEVGTPLIIAEGMRGVRELRMRYPQAPIVADLKTMDGGWLEAEVMAKAGASMVVVMGQAHEETIELVVKAGRDFGAKVMGDNMAMPDPIGGAKRLEDLGCDYVIHHIGFDMRTLRRSRGQHADTPLDRLAEVVAAVSVPVQAVGGLTLEQATDTPRYGAPLVVVGAPLAIDPKAFRTAQGDVEAMLRLICEKVHAFGDVKVGKDK